MQISTWTITDAVLAVFSKNMSRGQLIKLRPDVKNAVTAALGGREVIDLAPRPEERKLIQGAR